MKYVDSNGNDGYLNVGAAPVPGTGFAFITLSYEDVANPHFLAWFLENIHCRFINPVISH